MLLESQLFHVQAVKIPLRLEHTQTTGAQVLGSGSVVLLVRDLVSKQAPKICRISSTEFTIQTASFMTASQKLKYVVTFTVIRIHSVHSLYDCY